MTEIRLTLPLLVFTIAGIMLFVAGGLTASALLLNKLDEIRAIAVDGRTIAIKNQEAVYDVERRTITMEGNVGRLTADVAEIKLQRIPQRR